MAVASVDLDGCGVHSLSHKMLQFLRDVAIEPETAYPDGFDLEAGSVVPGLKRVSVTLPWAA